MTCTRLWLMKLEQPTPICCALNKGFASTFHVSSWVWQETPEEGRRTHWPERCEYNNEDNSLKQNDKNVILFYLWTADIQQAVCIICNRLARVSIRAWPPLHAIKWHHIKSDLVESQLNTTSWVKTWIWSKLSHHLIMSKIFLYFISV